MVHSKPAFVPNTLGRFARRSLAVFGDLSFNLWNEPRRFHGWVVVDVSDVMRLE